MIIRKSRRVYFAWIMIICGCSFVFMYDNIRTSNSTLMVENIAYRILNSNLHYSFPQQSWVFPKLSGKERILIFFGTRPEVIKIAPVIQELKKSTKFVVTTIFTGQHAEIIHPFLTLFNINVDIWFNNTLEKGQSLNMLAGKLFIQTDHLQSEPNDIWMIQGDTTSAMVIATVAFHKKLRIAHVEAGLRTFNMYSPFPEEFNRKTISSMATYHFAPTENNRRNLLNEGIDNTRIFVTGNTVIDSAKYLELSNKTKYPKELNGRQSDILVLLTIHRRENIDRMDRLYNSIASVKCAKCLFVVPVHPNPHATKAARTICSQDSRFLCISPLPYEELHWMLSHSKFILTDSGGIQEEATWYNVPTLVLRKETERSEAITAGIAKLVDELTIKPSITHIIENINKRNKNKVFPYGNGNAAERICNILLTNKLPTASIAIRPIVNKSNTSNVHQIEISPNYFDRFKDSFNPSIAVVLQVFKRNTLQKQLEAASKQTLIPSTIVVVQNGFYVNVSAIIQKFRVQHPDIELQHIASSKNLRFHGRFHIAYMLEEDYVSVWDDDMLPRTEWLAYCVEYSRTYGHGMVGANGRTFERVDLGKNKVIQRQYTGKNDFVGHTWTLPRVYLRYYLNMEPVSRYTGEDVQISYALQQYGIDSYTPPFKGERSVSDLKENIDSNASFKKNQAPRELLLCTLLRHNFKFLRCKNCKDKNVLDKCIENIEASAKDIVRDVLNLDKKNNVHSWS